MSQLSKVKTSRHQWKSKAQQRGDDNRYLRKQLARVKAQRHQAKQALKAAQTRLRQVESQAQAVVVRAKADVVWLALRLFLEARISFRAVSRVLALLADALGIRRSPCPQTVINWVIRLSMVRIACARQCLAPSLNPSAFSNGFIWMIDLSIALGSGKILAILALDAHHHKRAPNAPSLRQVHCIGVAVADSWTGEAIAEVLRRLIATLGRPTAYLKDGGGELRKAVEVLDEDSLSSPAIDDLSHAVAGMLKRYYHQHPAFERFVSACGRVSTKLKQTVLASLAPPTVRTKARFMNVHRLFTWADQLLQLSPPGGAKAGSILERLRAALDDLPTCKEFIKRFRADAQGLLECQRILKTRGLSHETLSQCDPLIVAMPTAAIRHEFQAYLAYELKTASSLGLDHIGLPMSSDAIESLFGVAKRHGVGPIQDVSRIALRLPALCGTLTRQEVDEVLGVSVARQQALTASFTSLTQQRREVLGHPERLERLSQSPGTSHLTLLPSPKNRSNNPKILNLSDCYDHSDGTPAEDANPKFLIEKTTVSGITEVSVAV